MKKILDFNGFLNESTAAGNMDRTYKIPFKYSAHDPKEGYNSRKFIDDLKTVFIEKPELKKEILKFITTVTSVSSIDDLKDRPFSEIIKIIPNIEKIIAAGEYEPELKMPGDSVLFMRNKETQQGKTADFYMNKYGTKIEVVTEDEVGDETVYIFRSEKFPYDRFNFNNDEIKITKDLISAKKSIS